MVACIRRMDSKKGFRNDRVGFIITVVSTDCFLWSNLIYSGVVGKKEDKGFVSQSRWALEAIQNCFPKA